MSPVGSGWLLQFPLSDYITKAGVRIEGNGIVPDVEAPMVKFGDPDTAVEKALALFKRAELREQRAGG
jgi:carboxyl-terminal processing protease